MILKQQYLGASFDGLIFQNPTLPTIREAWNKTYSVNIISTQVFTHVFAPLLLKSTDPRLLFITSGMSSLSLLHTIATSPSERLTALQPAPPAGWPKPPTPGVAAYAASKAAMNSQMLDWAKVFKNDGVKVWGISPGMLATGLGGVPELLKKMGAEDPILGGRLVREVVEGKMDGEHGKVVGRNGVQAW